MTRRKWHSAGLLALAVAAGFLAGRLAVWDRGPDAPERAPREPETAPAAEEVRLNDAAERRMGLKYAESEVRSVRQTIQATGAVGPNEPRLAHIRAMSRGRINAAYVRLGDRVKAGQPLVAYDNAELGEAIGEYLAALASIEKAHTEADVANRSLERARSLGESLVGELEAVLGRVQALTRILPVGDPRCPSPRPASRSPVLPDPCATARARWAGPARRGAEGA